ncbi:hypothetical protein [Streptomyces sp. NPDC048606]|uniref:hypothetical protein n=1 Tax=Streptomyces sp. NPDC048606 TaxID=3154726 RepID=UPI00343C0D1D
MATDCFLDLHEPTPTVYLDQWVWIRLARAANGSPREASDVDALAAVRDASAAGVVFPLSHTHYFETSKITDPRQRFDLARIMASVSHGRTLRSRQVLMRHQVLHAMYECFGRPTFRPKRPQVLGFGAMWAVTGEHAPLALYGPAGKINVDASPELQSWLRQANQYAEFQVLAGPRDEEISELRAKYGYQPETALQSARSRLEWESTYSQLLASDPVSRPELRVRVQAREMMHEHSQLLTELLAEYRLDLHRAVGLDPTKPESGRKKMVAFADRIASVRIAVDLKTELFRNRARPWKLSALHDIDALSLAVPYCHVVVPDADMADLLSRSDAGQRSGTGIVKQLRDLPSELQTLRSRSDFEMTSTCVPDGYDPAAEFCTDMDLLHRTAPWKTGSAASP